MTHTEITPQLEALTEQIKKLKKGDKHALLLLFCELATTLQFIEPKQLEDSLDSEDFVLNFVKRAAKKTKLSPIDTLEVLASSTHVTAFNCMSELHWSSHASKAFIQFSRETQNSLEKDPDEQILFMKNVTRVLREMLAHKELIPALFLENVSCEFFVLYPTYSNSQHENTHVAEEFYKCAGVLAKEFNKQPSYLCGTTALQFARYATYSSQAPLVVDACTVTKNQVTQPHIKHDTALCFLTSDSAVFSVVKKEGTLPPDLTSQLFRSAIRHIEQIHNKPEDESPDTRNFRLKNRQIQLHSLTALVTSPLLAPNEKAQASLKLTYLVDKVLEAEPIQTPSISPALHNADGALKEISRILERVNEKKHRQVVEFLADRAFYRLLTNVNTPEEISNSAFYTGQHLTKALAWNAPTYFDTKWLVVVETFWNQIEAKKSPQGGNTAFEAFQHFTQLDVTLRKTETQVKIADECRRNALKWFNKIESNLKPDVSRIFEEAIKKASGKEEADALYASQTPHDATLEDLQFYQQATSTRLAGQPTDQAPIEASKRRIRER